SLLLERRLVDARYLGFGAQLDLGDAEPGVGLVEVHVRRRVDARRGEARLGQAVGERHREAAGVGGGDELLGICAGAVLEAGAERVLPFEGAPAEAHGSLAIGQVALPPGLGLSYGHLDILLGPVDSSTPDPTRRSAEGH